MAPFSSVLSAPVSFLFLPLISLFHSKDKTLTKFLLYVRHWIKQRGEKYSFPSRKWWARNFCFAVACWVFWLGRTEALRAQRVSMPGGSEKPAAAFALRMKGPATALGWGWGWGIWLGIKAGKDKEKNQGKGPSTGQTTEFHGLTAIPCGAWVPNSGMRM